MSNQATRVATAAPNQNVRAVPGAQFSRRRLLHAIGAGAACGLTAMVAPVVSGLAQAPNGPESSALPTMKAGAEQARWQRHLQAYQLRLDAAEHHLQTPPRLHTTNGDEERYPSYIANFSKALTHNGYGEVQPTAYRALIAALGGTGEYSQIPLGGDMRLANPQAAMAYQLEGIDSHNLTIAAPPTFDSVEIAGELVELYWHALARDVPFVDYGQEALTAAAPTDLQRFPYFQPWQPAYLFRGETPGDRIGPYLSQFLTLPIPYGATTIPQRYRVPLPGDDHMTTMSDWLRCQNGALPNQRNRIDPEPRYLRNGRDLGEYVHQDFTYQSYLNAALIMNSYGQEALDDANPYQQATADKGFVTFGAGDLLSMIAQVANLALKAAWVQKWLVHRRLRPEVFAGRLHQHWTGFVDYPIHPTLEVAQGPQQSLARWSNYLLPQAYPEGCPTHPAYPAGHAVIAGACVTVLKAFFNENFVIPNPQVSDRHGLQLTTYAGVDDLTVGNELNKLAANIALGRDFAGVHWRSDGIQGLLLGEAVAVGLLQEMITTYPEVDAGFALTRFDGSQLSLRS